MNTITLNEPGRFSHSQTEPPHLSSPDNALVRVRRVGICGSDIHAFAGRQPFFNYPRILGHELGVEVVEVGANVTLIKVGDHCAIEPYLNCGQCIACRRGKTNCCASLQVLGVHTDGGMREFIEVSARKLHKSDNLTLDQLALVETLGIGAHAIQRADIQKEETILIIGAGPIGLTVMQFALQLGTRVLVTDVNSGRLDFCQKHLGITETLLANDTLLDAVKERTDGDLPTAVFDATGNSASMHNAFNFVAPGGKLIFVGLFLGDITFYDPDFHRRELTILASRNATSSDFRHILALMEAGQIDTTPWITHRADSADMIAHFPDWIKPEHGVIKAVVEF